MTGDNFFQAHGDYFPFCTGVIHRQNRELAKKAEFLSEIGG
jgi:hypothetical protein